MKKLTLWLSALLLVFAACSDGGNDEPGGGGNTGGSGSNPTPTITIDSSILSSGLVFDAKGGEQSVTFSTTVADWTLTVATPSGGTVWCTASATNGKAGSATVKFTTTENSDYDDRSVSVTIKAGTVSKTFTITQKSAEGLLVTSKKFELEQSGGTIDVEVKANITYQLEVAETAKDWITSAANTRALTTKKHTFNISASEELEKREGEIYVKSGDKLETIKIYQAGGAILVLTKNEYNVGSEGETITIDVKSNFDYEVQLPDVDWILNEAATRGASSHSLKYVVAANETYDSREAEIVFYDKNSDLKETVKVVQAQKDAIVISEKSITAKSEGETVAIKLSANVDYEVTMPDVDWISTVTTRALVENTLYYKVAKNETNESRSARITFSNQASGLSETVTITQQQNDVLQLSQKEYAVGSAGETIEVKLSSNIDYEVIMPKEADWITAAPATRGLTETILKYVVAANETYDSREAEIVFKDKNSEVSDTVKVTQAQKDAIVISEKNISVDSKGGSVEVKVNSNVDFEVQIPEDATWITQATTRGLTERSVFFNVAENSESDSRSAEITIINKESNVSEKVTISQQGNMTVVTLTKAGWLGTMLGDNYGTVKSLKIIGPLNGDDIINIQKMVDIYQLRILDLSEASIVVGGGSYYRDDDYDFYYTSNDEIGNYMFKGLKLTSIALPENIITIGDYAFSGCSSLTSVTIPNSVTKIGTWAFRRCSSLTSVTIPSSVTEIGDYVFYDCSSLTSVTIENGVTEIGDYVFYGCSSLTSVTIPNSVTKIGTWAFYRCSSLTSVTIPSSVTEIGTYAFSSCSSLTSVTIPSSVTEIGTYAFNSCSSLTSVTIENGVTKIGDYVFSHCSSLTSVTIPSSVTEIGTWAFYRCSSLTSVTIPSSVTEIGSMAFSGCSSLTSVTIPSSVTEIGEFTFSDCSSLTSVTIPSSVTTIKGAFNGCSSLSTVHCYAATPPSIGSSSFSRTANSKLYVPKGSKAAYEASDWYDYFYEIIEMEE